MTSIEFDLSVLMPCYNAENSVRESILSAIASCRLSNLTFEILVVNDGSSDASRYVLDSLAMEHPEVIVEHLANNGGIVQALNYGLGKARGRYIFRLDADDTMYPQRVATQAKFLDSHPACGVVGSAVDIHVENDVLTLAYPVADADIRFFLLTANCMAHPAVTYRRNLIQSVGGYLPQEFPCEDYGLWLRLLPATEFHNISEPLTKLRITPGSISDRHSSRQAELSAELVEKYLAGQHPNATSLHEVASLLCGRSSSAVSPIALMSLKALHDRDKPGNCQRLASWLVVDSIRLVITRQKFRRLPFSLLTMVRPHFVIRIFRASKNRRKLRMRMEQEAINRIGRVAA